MINPDFQEYREYKQTHDKFLLLKCWIGLGIVPILAILFCIAQLVRYADYIDNLSPKVVAWLVFGISALIGLLWAKNKIFKG